MAFFKTLNLIMVINRSQINEVVLSVTDQSTLSIPIYYLFELKRQASNVKVYFIKQIDTNYGTRQLFTITEPADVSLKPGTYEYRIYQQSSSTNTDPANTTVAASGMAWVAAGLLTVIQTSTDPVQYTGSDNTNPVYEG